ncbi:putative AC transposase [Purpureocillium lavendulum]|uniref:AC transposase n=1 Tax=Purpureocillium lavendulum TaxID=1247861 RepID=A0AB34FT01_9HYPO|nr:putative AC transposase [Purpureocillium lavendulum]
MAESNARPIAIFASYLLTAAALTAASIAIACAGTRRPRGSVAPVAPSPGPASPPPAAAASRRRHARLVLFAGLAALSLATTWYHMFAFFRWSYLQWSASRRVDDGLRLGDWLRDTALFKQAWASTLETPPRAWWSLQIFGFCANWSLALAAQARRRAVPHAWVFVLLGQIVAISFAMNLSFVAFLLHDVVPAAAAAGGKRKGKASEEALGTSGTSRLLSYGLLSLNIGLALAVPANFNHPRFLWLLLAPHVLAFVPALLNALLPPGRALAQPSWPAMFASHAVVVAAATAPVLAEGGLGVVVQTLSEHPAVSSVGWDVICCWLSSVAWYATVAASPRDMRRYGVTTATTTGDASERSQPTHGDEPSPVHLGCPGPHCVALSTPPDMQLPLIPLQLGVAAARTLQPWTYTPLPLGAVKPGGWLLGEMQAMADGLAGHEHDFYVFVNESSWLNEPGKGGSEYSTLNEGLPYWFNSLVPLAYTLDSDRLKAQVHEVATTVLGHQASDGWIGPEVGDARNFWARMPFFLGLTQLVEANATWEAPVLASLHGFMPLANEMLKNDSQGFANCRKDWLLEHHPSDQDALLWETMDLFFAQSQYRWDSWYTKGTFQEIADPNDESIWPFLHGVNVGQGLKASSVAYRINGSREMVQKSHDAVDWTFKHHGSASGTVLADERERDLAPYMGSELCTAVEAAYSLAYMYQALGSNDFADRAERAVFNAFPVMMTGDKWAHQYMAQPNQPHALNVTADDGHVPPVFTNANGGMALIFGMEPQYPCCTVNHPQGYPKFVSNSWVAVGEKGLGHVLLGPSTVTARVNGGAVKVTCDTAYPFDDVLRYTVEAERDFDLYLRSSMRKIRTEARSNNTVAVFHGSLLYALELRTKTTSSYPHATSAWNVAVDPSTLEYHGLRGSRLPDPVFAQGAPPNYMTVDGCEIEWDLHLGLSYRLIPFHR